MESLRALLADGTQYAPNYLPSGNSDHMPMTLCAMWGLGADLAMCEDYLKDYSRILHRHHQGISPPDWRLGIGNPECYPALLIWFGGQVRDKGIARTVGEYVPEFLSSMVQEAFHPLLRLAYAIDFDSAAEVAAGLAYLAASHQEGLPLSAQRVDLEQRLRAQVAAGPRDFVSDVFSDRITELSTAGEYPSGSASDLATCAGLALDLYRSTRNFFALHLVTVTHAVRICSPLVDANDLLSALTGSMLAAHRALGSPNFARAQPAPIPARLDREHRFKYGWSCLAEYRSYGDPRYLEELLGFRQAGLLPDWCAADLA